MLTCVPGSVLPVDERVLASLPAILGMRLSFDPEYLKQLPHVHGGVPTTPYFTTPKGEVRRIGWFVSFLDSESHLLPPFVPAFYFQRSDCRVDDRSIPGILTDVINPYFGGERIFPLAALFTDGAAPLTLRLYTLDSAPDDSLCFDQATTPPSIVLCNGQRAAEEIVRWDDGQIEELDYERFTEPVAKSFSDLLKMLREKP
jgi:hypothetical protein